VPPPSMGTDLAKMVADQLQQAIDEVRGNGQVPPQLRDKIVKKLEKARDKLNKKLAKMDFSNMDEVGETLGEVGEEIGEDMGQFGEEMGKWGEQFGKQFAKQFTNGWSKQGNGNGVHIHISNGNNTQSSN